MPSIDFSNHHLAVTVRKEDEKYSTANYDQNRLSDPQEGMSLSYYMDNENIIGQVIY